MAINPTIPQNFAQLIDIQRDNESKLLDLPNVVGVAVANKYKGNVDTGMPCISVLVSAKLDEGLLSKDDLVPQKVKDVPTDVMEVGNIFAGNTVAEAPPAAQFLRREQPVEDKEEVSPRLEPGLGLAFAATTTTLTRRVRPAMGGYSCGHYQITAGTIATCCYDLTPFPSVPGRYYLLSNNHVLANSNDAKLGDPILQPGPYDGGQLISDEIARLANYVPIKFKTPTLTPINYVDAAIAEGNFHDLSREIYWCGYVKDLYFAPKVNDVLQKCGRTTGFTTGRVVALNATVDVNYGGGKVARFSNQIITSRMGAPGDSGSLVMDLDERAVGLLFAGSSTHTIINNILWVQSLLKIRLHEK